MERMVAGLSIRTRYLSERYPYKGESYLRIAEVKIYVSLFTNRSIQRTEFIVFGDSQQFLPLCGGEGRCECGSLGYGQSGCGNVSRM